MKVDIVMIEVERHNCPSNSDIDHHIKSIKKINIGQIFTCYPPHIGETIVFKNKNYKIIEVIRTFKDRIEHYTVQVVEYNTKRFQEYGSHTWYEDIPLVTDIE